MMSPTDMKRIHRFAERLYRIKSGHVTDGVIEDFIQEAMTRLLDGRRAWYPASISFLDYMFGAVQSLVSHWYEEQRRLGISPFTYAEPQLGGWGVDLTDACASPESDFMWHQKYATTMSMLIASLQHSPRTLDILVHKTIGHSAEEIMTITGLSRRQYMALDRQLRRAIRAIDFELRGPLDFAGYTKPIRLTFAEMLTLAARVDPDEFWQIRFVTLYIKARGGPT